MTEKDLHEDGTPKTAEEIAAEKERRRQRAQTRRVIDIYKRLWTDAPVNLKDLAENVYHVSVKTVQRDMDNIRSFFSEYHKGISIEHRIQDRKRYYYLERVNNDLSKRTMLILLKILLSSRVLNKKELSATVESLLALLAKRDADEINALIQSEYRLYEGPSHNQDLLQWVWELSNYITKKQTVKLTYQGMVGKKTSRLVLPEALVTDAHYFYLVSYSDKDQAERFFRVDRILDVKKSRKVIKLPREEQFSAGSEEKLIHYMHSGTRSETFTVNYRGLFETVKDQFPSARETKIVKANESPFETVREIKFEAYERGTLMWLLSQGERVELVKPTEARRRLKEQVERMLAQYAN